MYPHKIEKPKTITKLNVEKLGIQIKIEKPIYHRKIGKVKLENYVL